MLKIKIRIFLDRAEITDSKFRNCPRTTTSAPTTTPVLAPAPLAATENRPVPMWQWIAIGLGCALIIIVIVIIIRFSTRNKTRYNRTATYSAPHRDYLQPQTSSTSDTAYD